MSGADVQVVLVLVMPLPVVHRRKPCWAERAPEVFDQPMFCLHVMGHGDVAGGHVVAHRAHQATPRDLLEIALKLWKTTERMCYGPSCIEMCQPNWRGRQQF